MIYQKILNVMKEVQHLQKDMTVGSGSHQYKAVSESKVTSEVRKSLIKHNLVFRQHKVLEDSIIKIDRDQGKVSFLHRVKIKYRLVDLDADSDILQKEKNYVDIEAVGTGIDPQDKGSGKAQTYAYKYALLRLFAIPTGEDPDRKASVDKEGKMKASEAIFNGLIAKVKQGTVSAENIRNNFILTEEQTKKLESYE